MASGSSLVSVDMSLGVDEQASRQVMANKQSAHAMPCCSCERSTDSLCMSAIASGRARVGPIFTAPCSPLGSVTS